MKKYTHAWLAMMAMKRIERATIPDRQADDARALITWFKNYRDFVLSGAWYPDSVFKDMGTSHIAKYKPDDKSDTDRFTVLPKTLQLYQYGLKSDLYGKPYYLDTSHNICDRCEAFTESLIDSFKILTMENGGSPIVPSNNHIAMRFFILSHYIADCHMPLHCDARSFANDNDVHAFIEEEWDKQVQSSYYIDEDNERFFYDPEGYPRAKQEQTELIQYVEKELKDREFIWKWGGDGCKNTWSYMSGVSQYSYLMAYRLIPADKTPKQITRASYRSSAAYKEHFLEYSKVIMADAVESIAKVWLHAWVRYRDWFRGTELAYLNKELTKATTNLDNANKTIDTYETVKATLLEKVAAAQASVDKKQTAFDEAVAKGNKTETKAEDLKKALAKLEKEAAKLDELEKAYADAQASLDNLKALLISAQINYDAKNAEIKKYEDSNSGI